MDYLDIVQFTGSPAWRSARIALLGAALVGGAFAAQAGEPIRFSGRTGAASAQDFDRREPLLPAEARGGGKSVPRADFQFDQFLLPSQSITPTTGLTRRQAEALDQRRNWLLQSPDTILKQATERDDGNPRDSRDPRDERDEREAPKSSVERYLEGRDSKADPDQKLKQGDSAQKQARDRERERNSAGNRGNDSRDGRDGQENSATGKSGENRTGFETGSSGTARGAADNSFFGTTDTRGGAMSRVVSEAREQERMRERDASLEAFKRNFNNPWAQPTSAGAGALLGSGGGATGPLGLPGSDFRRPASMGGLNPGGRSGVDLGPRGGGLGDFDPKNPLNYGAPETVLKQNDAPRVAPKPVVLEIPKRKF